MPSRTNYDLLPRASLDLELSTSLDDNGQFKDKPLPGLRWRRSLPSLPFSLQGFKKYQPLVDEYTPRVKKRMSKLNDGLSRLKKGIARVCRPLYIAVVLGILLLWQVIFNGSYMNAPGFEIVRGESVYIAANIIDGELISGEWGKSLQALVGLIGEQNVFVSIYGGPGQALKELGDRLKCEHALVDETVEPLDMASISRTTLPTGESRIKRIAYLAEVRNKALEPLEKMNIKGRRFDKILFINDVFFTPVDATRLLWGTNLNKNGIAEYKAVCAADFITSWKYYDTFATRDVEGYSIGVPLFPWFANEGDAITRKDVLAGRDNVRVKSCWGGMVAFDGRYFQDVVPNTLLSTQKQKSSKRWDIHDLHNWDQNTEVEATVPNLPLRFRSEPETFWDSSECCLIHADIMATPPFPPISSFASTSKDPLKTMEHHSGMGEDENRDTGIYVNPFVRVAYTKGTFSWIVTAKRFERLFVLPQRVLNHFAHMPVFNVRRKETEGQIIDDRVWMPLNSQTASENQNADAHRELGDEDSTWQGSGVSKRATIGKSKPKGYWENEGYYADFKRTAERGGYCGVRQLLVVKEGGKKGEGNWDNLLDEVPPLEDWIGTK